MTRGKVLLFVSLACASLAPAQTTAPAGPAAPAARVALAPYGIEITGPAGWVRQWERPAGAIARWSPPGVNRDNSYLQVTAARRTDGDTARKNAEREAGRFGTTVRQTTVDGEPAFLVPEPSLDLIGGITMHGDVVYGVIYAHPGRDQAVLDDFCAAWRWRAIESASRLIELAPERLRVSPGFTLRVPSWMRAQKSDRPGVLAYFIDSTFLTIPPTERFALAVGMLEQDQGKPLEEIARLKGKAIAADNKLAAPIVFRRVGHGDRIISDVVRTSDPVHDRWRWAVIAVDQRARVLLCMDFHAADPPAEQAFAKLAEDIAMSLEPVREAATPTTPATAPAPNH